MNIILGSQSERKIKIANKVFKTFINEEFFIKGYPSQSKVSETPWGKETYFGAINRAIDAKENTEGDYFVGIESGLVERFGSIYEEAWCCIIGKEGNKFFGYSSGLKVPDLVINKMDELGLEHYKVMEFIEKENGLKDSDTWGNYSGQQLTRDVSLEESIRNTLCQIFTNEHSLFNSLDKTLES